MRGIHHEHGFVLFPLYEDEGYAAFCWWEIYDEASWPDEPEPLDTATTLIEARSKVRAIRAENRFADALERWGA